MVDKKKEIKITNRSDSLVGYTIPDLGNLHDVRRQFAPKETKTVLFEELEALMWTDGGDVLLKNYLLIQDEEALKELLPDTQPEYFYTRADVEKLIKEGTYDQFLDCLTFAPEGVLEMVKDLAVSLPLTDTQKMAAMDNRLGFNVAKAIEIEQSLKEDNKVNDDAAAPVSDRKTSSSGRRAAPINSTSTHNYTIVGEGK